jgi:hypothetical protein
MIQHKRTAKLMQIKGLHGVEITQTSFRTLEDWEDVTPRVTKSLIKSLKR